MYTTAEPILDPVVPATETVTPEVTRDLGFYRRELMPELGQEIFKPNPDRLVWYTVAFLGCIVFFAGAISFAPTWPLKALCGVGLGLCNGLLGFISHELLHGSVIKNQRAQMILGFFGMMSYLISPTYWKHSHNRLHHGKTQQSIRDPDAFPTLRIYKSSKFVQTIFRLTPGSGYARSIFYFFYFFSYHELAAQITLRFRNGNFDAMNHRRVNLELLGQFVIFAGLLALAGPSNWLWVLVIPLAVQNYVLMSYISTNHNLSPLTQDNDPLKNSLTVTNHPILEFLTLNFGYHVEHHLFPTVSGKHTKKIHYLLIKKFPDTYKYMPKWKAMRALYSTPRIYKNSTTLIHPETLKTFDTI